MKNVNLTDEQVTEFFGEKELRWYQVAARHELVSHLKDDRKRVCIVLPTGAGKTLTVASSLSNEDVRDAIGIDHDRKMRVLFCAHKHCLLTQAEKTFAASLKVEIISQSIFSEIPEKEMQKGFDIIVLDEAHHEACMTFQIQLRRLAGSIIVGLTATPDRADTLLIKFEKIVQPISRERAVDEGWLAPTNLNSIVDATGRDKVGISQLVFEQYLEEMGKTIMFFRTKKECEEVDKYLKSLGKKSVCLTSNNKRIVQNALDAFSRGEIQFIVNCSIVSEGVDVVGCTDIFLGRAVGSYPLLNQIIGRAARPDSPCNVWELINPLSKTNLDTTVVVGTPERHRLLSRRAGHWKEQEFDYISQLNEISGVKLMG